MEAFFTFVNDHRIFAVIMFAMSLAAVTLVVWRLLLNFNARTNLDEFMPRFQEVLQRDGVESAISLCRDETGFIPRRLFVVGLENCDRGAATMRRAMARAIELDIRPDLEYLLAPILAIAKIATMVGLLGTVVSMIGTFQALGDAVKSASAGSGGGGQAQASREIGLALFATALGLVTAIPLVFSHVLFKSHVHKFETKMKSAAEKLLVLVQGMKTPLDGKPSSAPHPSPGNTAPPLPPALPTVRAADRK
jgi:biopolymer transport protein ExbB